MKILHVITSLLTGGAEKLMVDLLPRLRQAGHDVDLAVINPQETPFMRQLRAKGVSILPLQPPGRGYYDPRAMIALRRLMPRYDIVHTHNTAPQLFAAAAGGVLCSVVLCTTEHNTSNRRRGWKWYAALDRWMYSRYDRVICISRKAEENLREHLGRPADKRILTVNNGIDVSRFANAEPSAELRSMAPEGSRIITMVAGFRWEKDQDTLIRALALLPERFRLALVGEGARQEECRRLAESLGVDGRTLFLGLRGDVPELLKASDYVAMSSHFEGLSLSSVEGMASGRPMLASDVDGLREVVGGAGVLFAHGDAEALAARIAELDADASLYAAVAARCAARAADYDIDKMAAGYLAVYNSLRNTR